MILSFWKDSHDCLVETGKKHSAIILALFLAFLLLGCRLAYVLSSANPTPSPTRTRAPVAEQSATIPSAAAFVVTPTPIPSPVAATLIENLRVRESPSATASVLDRLNKGSTVQVIGRTATSDWFQINLPTKPGVQGWISAEFVQLSGVVDSISIVQPDNTQPAVPGQPRPTVPSQPQPQSQPTATRQPPPPRPTSPAYLPPGATRQPTLPYPRP